MFNKNSIRILCYLLILTAVFLILQLSALATLSPLLKRMFHASNVPSLAPSWWQMGPFLVFVAIQILLYGLMTLGVWLITYLNAIFWKWNDKQVLYAALSIWLLTVLIILLLNQVFFPLSTMTMLLNSILPVSWSQLFLYPLVITFFVLIMGAWLGIWCKARQHSLLAINLLLIITICIIIGGILISNWHQFITPTHNDRGSANKPNIIMIGIDSLRPDYTNLGEGQPIKGQSLTPKLDNFAHKGTVFTQAFTPLARTFPSWTSILTGQYPIHNGVRFDLYPKSQLSLQYTLPHILQKQGYTTYFATDERRFSNISHRFGIEHVLGPKTGFFDFLLGNLNDFPLSNLIINSPVGHWLFPYTSINRSAFITYEPRAFNAYVERHLLKAPSDKPIFLAIHFCLPHWPYIWRESHLDNIHDHFPRQLYAQSVERADRQVANFIQFLKQNHFLEHSIVVVLSDHGEALLKKHDRVISYHNYQPGLDSAPDIMHTLDNLFNFRGFHFNTSYGHGTDVLSQVQNHIVLAMQASGLKNNANPFYSGQYKKTVSTVDIKPTILQLLSVPSQTRIDGKSLVACLKGSQAQCSKRPVFMETGIAPPELQRNGEGLPNTLTDVLNDYQLHDDMMISLRPQAAEKLIPFKQRAVRQGHWLLALYPLVLPHQATILVNLENGQWTDDLNSSWAQQAPVPLLERHLRKHYGQEVAQQEPFLITS